MEQNRKAPLAKPANLSTLGKRGRDQKPKEQKLKPQEDTDEDVAGLSQENELDSETVKEMEKCDELELKAIRRLPGKKSQKALAAMDAEKISVKKKLRKRTKKPKYNNPDD